MPLATPSTVTKRSVHIRKKKLKVIGLKNQNLSDKDILLINFLTVGNLILLGQKCSIKVMTDTSKDLVLKLKNLKTYKCKWDKNVAVTAYVVF